MIRLHDVTKQYPGGVRAVRSVSLSVRAGEMAAIVGPSGSGKSTLLHLIGALDRPSSGQVEIAGHDVGAQTDRRLSALRATTIGFVFQQFHLAPGVAVLDAVADGLLYLGVPVAERRRRAAEALDRVSLGHRRHHRPHELSGGERQRAAIARALVKRPPLVLADEPTGNLDTASGAVVLELIEELHADGVTVLVITHDRDVAARAPRRVEMRDGAIVRDTAAP